MMMMMMMMMMNCFCGMVDRRKAFSLISSRDHCQRSSPLRISDTPRAGFEPAQSLSSCFVESPRRHTAHIKRKHPEYAVYEISKLNNIKHESENRISDTVIWKRFQNQRVKQTYDVMGFFIKVMKRAS